MRVILKTPRLHPAPLGEQRYIYNMLKFLLQAAPKEWDIVLQFTGLRGIHEHRRQAKLIDPQRRAQLQHIPVPEQCLETSIKKMNLPSAIQMFGAADIVHNLGCLWIPQRTQKLILTMLDVIPFRWNEGTDNVYTKDCIAEFIKFTIPDVKAFTTISEFSRHEIIDVFNIDPELVNVIPAAVDHELYRPLSEEEMQPAQHIFERLGIRRPYILYIGGQAPRKNVPRLVKAFGMAKDIWKLEHQLVIAGSSNLAPDVEAQISKSLFKEDIKVVGYLATTECTRLIQQAQMLVFPSLYEGFGLPPLEAMACGIPVAVSKAASLPEVCGDAAMYFDPYSEEQIAECMNKLASDLDLRISCITRGILQAGEFSWQRNVDETLALYARVKDQQ